MGKVEKIVVLSVLFMIVVILVYSTDIGTGESQAKDKDEQTAQTGEGTQGETPDQNKPVHPIVPEDTTPDEEDLTADVTSDIENTPDSEDEEKPAETAGLLTAETLTAPVYEVPDEIPEDWALTSMRGLDNHPFDPTHKIYKAKRGDTWEKVATRYYGEAAFVSLIQRANEGHASMAQGVEYLLPTHDNVGTETVVTVPAPVNGKDYVTLENDSLWKISRKVYGKGHLWPNIHQANLDLLPDPDRVPPGITLLIPDLD